MTLAELDEKERAYTKCRVYALLIAFNIMLSDIDLVVFM